MTKGLCKRIFSCWGPFHTSHIHQVDVKEEYAEAFRTQSYVDFWNRVVEITNLDDVMTVSLESPSSSSSRLPSYRLFAEHLLDPDQPTITALLDKTRFSNDTKLFLVDYFLETANASFLCSHLLKDIDHIRAKHRSLKKTIETLHSNVDQQRLSIPLRLIELCKPKNSFIPPSFSSTRFQEVHASCSELLKKLELGRDRVCTKLRFRKRMRRGCAMILVSMTVTFTIIIVSHGFFAIMACPGFVVTSIKMRSGKKLAKDYARLDAASKGTYILARDLDTISRMVARVKDELEHIRAKIGLVAVLSVEDRLQANKEVMRQLRKNEGSLREQMDELEEHLYLCFMTINRARNLVVKEVLDLKPS